MGELADTCSLLTLSSQPLGLSGIYAYFRRLEMHLDLIRGEQPSPLSIRTCMADSMTWLIGVIQTDFITKMPKAPYSLIILPTRVSFGLSQ